MEVMGTNGGMGNKEGNKEAEVMENKGEREYGWRGRG